MTTGMDAKKSLKTRNKSKHIESDEDVLTAEVAKRISSPPSPIEVAFTNRAAAFVLSSFFPL
jgi:hypothetical protein